MKIPVVVLVGLGPGEREIAIDAVRSLFPEALVDVRNDLDAFTAVSPRFEHGLVVVSDERDESIASVVGAVDESGLPRWAVVTLGDAPRDETAGWIARDDWNVRSAGQAFRARTALLAARREIARLRGDLKTVASRFSHDVRTPLGAILTTCELMEEVGSGPDAPLLRGITDSVDEVSLLVERLNLVLRATADPPEAETVDMGEVVFRALERIQCECRRKKAAIVVPEEWPSVRGVARHLEVVWDCLLADAMRNGGDSPRLRVGWERSAGNHGFWVEIDGTLAPELRARVVVPFHALHNQHSGGIDLSVVQRLVELHGGRLACEPFQEAGSRFFFTLPLPDE